MLSWEKGLAAWKIGYASGKSKNYPTFFRSTECFLCKSDTKKKSKKIKPASTAGRVWLFQAPIGGPDVSVLVLGVIHRADDEPVGDGGEGMVVIA